MAKRRMEEVNNLPEFEMCKFQRINKHVNNFTSTCNFSLRHPSNTKFTCGLIIQDHYKNVNELVLLRDDEEEQDDSNVMSCSSGMPEDFSSGKYYIIVGCNNGVVVFDQQPEYFGPGHLCVINPLTLQCRTVPRPTNCETRILGSVMMSSEQREGYDVDYNLFCFLPTPDWDNHVEYKIYSFKESRWMKESNTRLDIGSRSMNYDRPVLVEKTLYLVSDCLPVFKSEPYMVVVDVEQKTSEFLPLPLPLISCDYKIEIANWGDRPDCSLCLICWCWTTSSFTIWTAQDRKTWTWRNTTIEITFESMGLERPTNEEDVAYFTLVNGEKLVFNICKSIHVYDLRNGRRRRLNKELSEYLTLLPYTQCPR